MKTRLILLLFVLIAFNLSAEEKMIERFKGRVIDQTGSVPGFSATYFQLMVEKYTTDEDVQTFAKALSESGQDGLLKAIEKREMGRIKVGNRLSYPLSAIRVFEKDGQRLIRALTDRPIPMIEAWRNNRSRDYPFGFIQILIGPDGKGEGTLVAAAKIQIKDGKLEMESYGLEPFQLNNIVLDK